MKAKIVMCGVVIMCMFGLGCVSAAYAIDNVVRVKNIEYRYQPAGNSPYAVKEVKSFRRITTGSYNDDRVIELLPGERIVDHLFNLRPLAHFLFYGNDSNLSALFKEVIYSKAVVNSSGQIVGSEVKGVLLDSISPGAAVTLNRYDIRYDSMGRIYSCKLNRSPYGNQAPFMATVYSVMYDSKGRIRNILFGDGSYGYWEKYQVYNIKYDLNGEVTSCVTRYLGSS